jgi:hypothetical protein
MLKNQRYLIKFCFLLIKQKKNKKKEEKKWGSAPLPPPHTPLNKQMKNEASIHSVYQDEHFCRDDPPTAGTCYYNLLISKSIVNGTK